MLPPARVLVVEDEPSVRLLLETSIREWGYDVAVIESAAGARVLVDRQPPDLVITDIRLPDESGLQLTHWLKENYPQCDVILMTGYASLESAAEGVRLGAVDYLLKPFAQIELVHSAILRAFERRRMSAETQQLKGQLRHSDRLAAIGRLVAGVAHEVNNPAGMIMANCGVILDRLGMLTELHEELDEPACGERISVVRDDRVPDRTVSTAPPRDEGLVADLRVIVAEIEEMVDENRQGVERIADIVRDLQSFARSDDGVLETLDLREVVDAAASIAAPQFRHCAELVKRYRPVPLIVGRRGSLVQVFVNLLVNAGQAIDTGRDDGVITVQIDKTADWVRAEVIDNGTGMSPEEREQIFEPFFTTKERGQGTGLGLALSADIVERHHGLIHARSTAAQGSVFSVRLPIDEEAAAAVVRASEHPSEVDGGIHVLIIDDEPRLLRAMGRMLSPPHRVTLAEGGPEGLKQVREGLFDAIVCDLMMPELDGEGIYEWLTQYRPDLAERTLFITGGTVTKRVQSFAGTLGDRLLYKPFSAKRLMEGVRTCITGC